MAKYPKSRSVSKEGINFVRIIVERSNSIFNEVHNESDIGIDAHVEFIKDESPTNRMIALQIKSGKSYYNRKKNQCIIPVGKHFDYWVNYPLPVYGIVYLVSQKCGYWVNVKKYLGSEYEKHKVLASTIKFAANSSNLFDVDGLNKILTLEGGDPEVLPSHCYRNYKKIHILEYVGDDVKKVAYLLKDHSEIWIYGYALDDPDVNEPGQIVFHPPGYSNCLSSECSNALTYTRIADPDMTWDSPWDKQFYRWHLRFDDRLGVIAIERRSTSPS